MKLLLISIIFVTSISSLAGTKSFSKSCMEALFSIIKTDKTIAVGRSAKITFKNGEVFKGKVVSFSRGGMEVNKNGKNFLVSFNSITKVNNVDVSPDEVYVTLLKKKILGINENSILTVKIFENNRSRVVNGAFKLDTKKNLLTLIKNNNEHEIINLESISQVEIMGLRLFQQIQRDAKILDGEFVSVKLKNGETFDGIITITADQKHIELTDVHIREDVRSIPIREIKDIYQ